MYVLFFHGKYCPPCKTTGEAMEKWAKAQNLDVYSFEVSDPYGGYRQRVEWKVKHVPCAVLVDDNGAEAARLYGGAAKKDIERAFSPYVTREEETNECSNG